MKNFSALFFLIIMIISGPVAVYAEDMDSPAQQSKAVESNQHPGGYTTPGAWHATATTFMDGRLIYKEFNSRVAPGIRRAGHGSWDLTTGAGADFRDTVMKFPDTCKTIYEAGIIDNFMEYKIMAGNNWRFAKLSADDFAEARDAYVTEGNWGLVQTGYYCLKGSSRVVWALAILNSGEAVYKIVQAGGETVYYLLRYPVGGMLKVVTAPVVLVGGTAWSTVASIVTTGWALPFTAAFDTLKFAGGLVWPG